MGLFLWKSNIVRQRCLISKHIQ